MFVFCNFEMAHRVNIFKDRPGASRKFVYLFKLDPSVKSYLAHTYMYRQTSLGRLQLLQDLLQSFLPEDAIAVIIELVGLSRNAARSEKRCYKLVLIL